MEKALQNGGLFGVKSKNDSNQYYHLRFSYLENFVSFCKRNRTMEHLLEIANMVRNFS